MARPKKSATSASKENVAKVSSSVGRPNQTVAAMKEEFAHNEELSKLMFDKASQALKQYKDPNTNSSYTLNAYDRDAIRGYLKAPASNEANLRNVAKYLFYRSQILYRLVHWYADMWDLRCRNVKPTFDIEQGIDSNALKNYNETLKWLDIYNLQENFHELFMNCYLYDVCYFLWFRDETGAIPYVLPPEACKIVGKYMTKDYAIAVDMSQFRSKAKQQLIEFIGDPLESMYNEYVKTGVKYILVPDEYAGCLKFNFDQDLIVPPFAPLFQTLSSLLDTEDLAAVQDKLDVFKMLVLPMETLKKNMNDFAIDPSLVLDYWDRLIQDALPPYISAAVTPGTAPEVIDFSSTASDAQVDRVSNAQKNIFNVSGGGAVLNTSNINSSEAFKTWCKAETEFALSSLIGQVDGFANRMLSYDVSSPCQVKHFEVSIYTKDDFRKSLLEACQYSFSYRLALGTLYGMSESDTLALLHFEQETLGLQNLMINPLQSSYTNSGETETDPITGGRPEKDVGDLSPSGERSRNK